MTNRTQDGTSDGEVAVVKSKRVLLKAGWVVPVVVALSLPASSYAQNSSRGGPPPGRPRRRRSDDG